MGILIIVEVLPKNFSLHMINRDFMLGKNRFGGNKWVHKDGQSIDVWFQTPEGYKERALRDGYENPTVIKL